MARLDPFDSAAIRSSLKARTAKGLGVTFATQMGLFSAQFLGSVLLARLLSPDDFGLVGMVVAITGFFDTFRDLGLTTATVQRKEITPNQVNVLFWINLAVSAGLGLLICLFSPFISYFYGRSELVPITIALSIGFMLFGANAQHSALLRRSMQFKTIAKIDIASTMFSICAALSAAWMGCGYWSLVLQRLSKPVAAGLGYWINSGWTPRRPGWDPSVKPMLRFGGFLAANNILNYAARNVDNIAIGRVWGGEQLGLYTRAYSLLMLPMSQLGPSMVNVVVPALGRIQNEAEKFRHAYLSLLRAIGLTVVPFVAVLISCSEAVVYLVLGPQWSGTAEIFRWLGVAAIIQPMTTTCGMLFVARGRSKELSKSTLITSMLAVLSIVCAVPWGTVAVAGSYAISGMLVRTPVLFHFAGKVSAVSTRDLYKSAIPSVLIAFAIISVNYLLSGITRQYSAFGQVASSTFVGGMVVLVACLIFRSQREVIAMILDFASKVFSSSGFKRMK